MASNPITSRQNEVKRSESQSCPTLCDPVDCSLPGSSIHGILQARILEWVAISFSRGSSRPRDWTNVSYLVGRRFTLWATREAIDWETMETVTGFIFLDSKITTDDDCSHEIKRCLLLGRKDVTNLDSILKSRDITLPTKIHLVKAMVFPRVMYGCESWTIKEAEHQRTDAFELWCWRRPWESLGLQGDPTSPS